jgi:hypothetical protein
MALLRVRHFFFQSASAPRARGGIVRKAPQGLQ